MAAEIGELSVDQYLSLASSAGAGQTNALLRRSIDLHGSSDRAMDAGRRFAKLLEIFAARFGKDRQVCLYESPGRVNLMGMHIDHRGGIVNPVATQERVRAVCSRRDDDLICGFSTSSDYGQSQFRISERLPEQPLSSLGQWLDWTEKQAAAIGGSRDFINYFACGPVYLACFHYPRGRRFAGANFVLDSDLPPSAGLSSSSALVSLDTDFFLRCNPQGVEDLSLKQLLEVYGNGEWYIGTRGGTGDHAAIKLSQRGSVQPMITTPEFRACQPAPFPQDYQIILYQSGDQANKAVEPFKTAFNAPIISYLAAEMFLADYLEDNKSQALEQLLAGRAALDPKHHRIYLGDVVTHELFTHAQMYRFLQSLPRVISQKEIFSRFEDRVQSFQHGLRQAAEPKGGYHVRDVAAFGLSESARGKRAGSVLADGDIDQFADMMNVSQLGDRITELQDDSSARIKFLRDQTLSDMEKQGFDICQIAGDYHVSTANIDRLVSICLGCPDVLAARLSGAGLGGMLIVLGREGFDQKLDSILQRDYYEPLKKQFRKIPIVPSQGAGFY